MSEQGLTRYDENYDEGGYLGIGMSADGRYYKATDIDLMRTQALELARMVVELDAELERVKGINTSKPSAYWQAAQRFREEWQ